ncbi:hypothetical protein [Streptococcus sp. DD10]|uniref:hypothetical protein n=1 Tax=Streptococcus sp. DD10 TaxID=1777878 RepID=UPI000832B1BC|nr:hypothetical protein [Streptococcus sp. DD10]
MRKLRNYILEICFGLSFSLPFLKWANVDDGKRLLETYYGYAFLLDHFLVTSVFLLSLFFAWKLQKKWSIWLAVGSYVFLAIWVSTEGYLFRMSLEELIRLWTSLDILTQIYQPGFYPNILLGFLLSVKYLKLSNKH